MIRLGLCCIFKEQPLSFKQTTATALQRLPREKQLEKISQICRANLDTLHEALKFLVSVNIHSFRVLSPLFPRYTHPDVAYTIDDLPGSAALRETCSAVKEFRQRHDIRLSLHPDQFNVLSSPHRRVVTNTLRELEYQGLLAELIGAEVINIHAGGVYGSKREALRRFRRNFMNLSKRVRIRLSVENDDRSYRPADLLPLCSCLDIPFVYDVHHHRCLPDGLSVEAVTERCVRSWHKKGREPYFHLSSPRDGWRGEDPRPHADYIDPADFPSCWFPVDATIDVEAKAKELAVIQLAEDLSEYLGSR